MLDIILTTLCYTAMGLVCGLFALFDIFNPGYIKWSDLNKVDIFYALVVVVLWLPICIFLILRSIVVQYRRKIKK